MKMDLLTHRNLWAWLDQAQRVRVQMKKWQSTMRKEFRIVMKLEWFKKEGLISLHDYTNATLKA
jgi:hypothetical protein